MASIIYTVSEVKNKINQFADKLGSDYFTLPVLLNKFETSAWDFIGEKLKLIETTQTITDDIRPLIVTRNLAVLAESGVDTAPTGVVIPARYLSAEPSDYHRTVAYDVYYNDGTKALRADKIAQSEYRVALRNPNKSANKQYPLILQEASQFQIDCGEAIASTFRLTYCKKPTFGTTSTPDGRIINLPDDAIEKILLDVVTSLFVNTGDERSKSSYEVEESFRKIFR